MKRRGNTFTDLNRLREILQILVRHGFGLVISRLNLMAYLPWRSRKSAQKATRHSAPDDARRSTPERVRLMLEDLGPVYIKLGQTLSMRPDILPPDYIAELSKLQDAVPPMSKDAVREVLHEEFGAYPENYFKHFDTTPVAAASIAQVHHATTKDGRAVAIKIQRQGLQKILDSDIEILRFLARMWQTAYKQELPLRPVEFVDEFDRLMREELDFTVEGLHVDLLRKNFKDRPAYHFPYVVWSMTTSRCLTQEFIVGRKLTELPKKMPVKKREKLAQTLIDAYTIMALEDHFFHADPHPGNLLLDPEGRLVFLDAGQVGRLDDETVEAFTDMLLALVNQDTSGVVESYLALGTAEDTLDLRLLKRDVALFLERYYSLPVEEISFGKSLQALMGIALKYKIELPTDFVVLAKTFLGAESLARSLNPRLNLVEAVRPTAERILRERYEPKRMVQAMQRQFRGLGLADEAAARQADHRVPAQGSGGSSAACRTRQQPLRFRHHRGCRRDRLFAAHGRPHPTSLGRLLHHRFLRLRARRHLRHLAHHRHPPLREDVMTPGRAPGLDTGKRARA
jgi:ubiquinone biosynthesis protein